MHSPVFSVCLYCAVAVNAPEANAIPDAKRQDVDISNRYNTFVRLLVLPDCPDEHSNDFALAYGDISTGRTRR